MRHSGITQRSITSISKLEGFEKPKNDISEGLEEEDY